MSLQLVNIFYCIEAQILREYQVEGVRFLKEVLQDPSKGGAILADEMGLGKTSMYTNYILLHIKFFNG